MKKMCLLLPLILFLCGCSGETIPTQPTDETATDPAPTSSMMPTETQWYNPEWVGCEVITPEEGVLILREDTVLENTVVDGDVYITANAQVSFVHVWVRGKLFVHGQLSTAEECGAYEIYAYKLDKTLCSAYDGVHGEIVTETGPAISCSGLNEHISLDALDYAFKTWGKVEQTEQSPTQVRSEGAGPSSYDPSQITILSGKQTIASKGITGDVYITSNGDITFVDVLISGNVYVAGKLHFGDHGSDNCSEIGGSLFAYDFGVTCEAFDGIHGQVTGGPVYCYKGYVVANDALDYAFETWGKQ